MYHTNLRTKAPGRLIYVTIVFIIISGCKAIPATTISPTTIPKTERLVIQVDIDSTQQVIDHFGVSGAWWAQEIGGWQANNRQHVVELLFDLNKGIGLSSYRYQIGAGGGGEITDPWRNTESFEMLAGVYDWSRDKNALRILNMVKDAGIDQFTAVAYSPPSRLTVSGAVTGSIDGGPNLQAGREAEYATYLVDVVKHLIREKNIPITWISPVYEPRKDWNLRYAQEGSNYSVDQIKILMQEIDEFITTNNLNVKILVPEEAQWGLGSDFLVSLLVDPLVEPHFDVYAVHSQFAPLGQKKAISDYLAVNFPDKKIWVTEWADPSQGRDTGIDSALFMARAIHEDLTWGNASSWQYGLAVSKYETKEGLMYITPGSQQIFETKRLWAFGNYSRFIRPGYNRINCTINRSDLLVSAYSSPEKDEIILVIINPTPVDQTADIQYTGLNWYSGSIYRTSQVENLERVYDGTLARSYSFPAFSISTLVASP